MVNKRGEVIASAVTNLDLHDIARACMCYGVRRFYVVTPVRDQQRLARRIMEHWNTGPGAQYNPARGQAFGLVGLVDSLEQAMEDAERDAGRRPSMVVTSARESGQVAGYVQARGAVHSGEPHMLVFGTAWGLAPEALAAADSVLAPIRGATGYNHLSVRSAVSVILDRLLGSC